MNESVQRGFVSEVKKRHGRVVIVVNPSGNNGDSSFDKNEYKVYDKENLELLEEINSGLVYRVRNADGGVGLVSSNAVVEIKL